MAGEIIWENEQHELVGIGVIGMDNGNYRTLVFQPQTRTFIDATYPTEGTARYQLDQDRIGVGTPNQVAAGVGLADFAALGIGSS